MTWTRLAASLLLLAACAPLADQRADRIEARNPPGGQMLRVGDALIHAEVSGQGPDVVLIHGASGNTRDMAALADRLDERYRVIRFDRPGQGYSTDLGDAGNSPLVQADYLRAAARQLGVRDPVVLGHSYGGAVAMAWALIEPDTRGVVLVSGAVLPWEGGLDRLYTLAATPVGEATIEPLASAFLPDAALDLIVDDLFAPNLVPDDYAADIGAELVRSRTLRERGISAENALETQQAAATSARAQVARLEAVLEQKQLLAPFAGVIGIAQIEVGDYVTPGTIVATLQNLDSMQVDFSVPEQDITTVKVGMPVTASTEVGDLSVKGKIIAIEPRVDPGSRLVAVRAEVENTDRALLPGQFMRVTVELPPEDGIIALPQTAVTSNLYGDSIYVVRQEGEALKVEQVFVQTGRRAYGNVEITGGIDAGDQVVIAGQNRLSSGAAVAIDNSVTPEATAD